MVRRISCHFFSCFFSFPFTFPRWIFPSSIYRTLQMIHRMVGISECEVLLFFIRTFRSNSNSLFFSIRIEINRRWSAQNPFQSTPHSKEWSTCFLTCRIPMTFRWDHEVQCEGVVSTYSLFWALPLFFNSVFQSILFSLVLPSDFYSILLIHICPLFFFAITQRECACWNPALLISHISPQLFVLFLFCCLFSLSSFFFSFFIPFSIFLFYGSRYCIC